MRIPIRHTVRGTRCRTTRHPMDDQWRVDAVEGDIKRQSRRAPSRRTCASVSCDLLETWSVDADPKEASGMLVIDK